MKKTQVALAALALVASSAALAEVKLYGRADMSVLRDDTGTYAQGAGNNVGSVWGITGSEDLGGGLKAGFNLESGINLANGQAANGGPGGKDYAGIWNRAANVNIGNETFTLQIGHQLSTFVDASLTGLAGVTGNSGFVPALARITGSLGGTLVGTAVGGAGSAASSTAFFYPELASLSVNMNGVTVTAQTKIGTKDAAGGSTGRYTAYSATTSVLGINVAAAGMSLTDETTGDKGRVYTIGGNTQFAGMTLRGAYGSGSSALYDGSGYSVGLDYPINDALSVGYTYAKSSYNVSDAYGAGSPGSQNTIGAKYSLSKQTFTYLTYSSFGEESSVTAGTGVGASKKVTIVGVAHSF